VGAYRETPSWIQRVLLLGGGERREGEGRKGKSKGRGGREVRGMRPILYPDLGG